jgi:single-strand DNA-binding protein
LPAAFAALTDLSSRRNFPGVPSGNRCPLFFPGRGCALINNHNRKEHTMTTTSTLIGNLTRDAEIRYTRDGQATTSLSVAVNHRWKNQTSNEWEESTSFFDVVCWRDLAENVALSLTKGARVIVTGRLEQRSWETEEGDRRFKVELVADEIGAAMRYATVDIHKVERHASTEGTEPSEAVI